VKRTLTKKLAVATGAAALAFGAVACDAETDGGLDPAQEDPMMEDDGGLEGEGDVEGEGEADLEG
jgi:hypothetical protein